jgi:hypothetical protein
MAWRGLELTPRGGGIPRSPGRRGAIGPSPWDTTAAERAEFQRRHAEAEEQRRIDENIAAERARQDRARFTGEPTEGVPSQRAPGPRTQVHSFETIEQRRLARRRFVSRAQMGLNPRFSSAEATAYRREIEASGKW